MTKSAPSAVRLSRSIWEAMRAWASSGDHAPQVDQASQGQLDRGVDHHHRGEVEHLPVLGPQKGDVQDHYLVGVAVAVAPGHHLDTDGRDG